ncbi:MAG: hypothetical protein IJW14_05090 [Oscillospiraceae bacterium]|nr:hypothetical protein [Oscillospiraceae bacterium]
MFGFVTANSAELSKEQKRRYSAVYCGICRCIRSQHTNTARLTLRYDMAFLALLLMSLYEPEEISGGRACALHPIKPRPWVDNEYIRYAADMNVALAYYQCLDDWRDDGSQAAHLMANHLKKQMSRLTEQYPRQCDAMEGGIARLAELENAGCDNPDEPANCFGQLMAQLMVYRQDLWEPYLQQMGFSLGRFIYLADAVADFDRDKRKGRYNPLREEDRSRWDEYLVLAMGRCTENYEKLPLVQDKALLDNILYSGVWTNFGKKKRQEDEG